MLDRREMQQLLDRLYAARVAGRLDELCGLFSTQAHFRIAGASDGKPIALAAHGRAAIRPWLAMMVKTFRLTRHEILTTLIDGHRCAVRWSADIHSRITGSVVATELVDLVEVTEGEISSYVEYFVPTTAKSDER
jgi:ketosteroid isomerase-like protein